MPRFLFDRFTLDTDLHELRTARDVALTLQPKAYALLAELVQSAQLVVSKQELLQRVWSDVKVTESSLMRAVSILRAELVRAGASRELVRTVHGAGYTLGAPVTRIDTGTSGAGPRSPDFAERERELALLHRCLDAARAGRGSLATVSGEPGIGKSRLLREFAWQAEQRGAQLLAGRCGEIEGNVAYGLWMDVVRAAAAGRMRELQQLLGGAAADLAPLIPSLARAEREPPADPEQARLRMFQAVEALLLGRATGPPVVIVLDDVHDADPGSLRLLEYLVHRITRGAVLVVLAFRDAGPALESPFRASLAELMRAGCPVQRVALRGLSAEGVAQLAAWAAGKPLIAADVGILTERTGGNPLFVREWVLSSDAAPGSEGWTRMPETVRRLIGLQLARLPAATRELLMIGAALGQRFAVETVARDARLPVDDVSAKLRPAELTGVVTRRVLSAEMEFTHALFRESLYADLPADARIDAHLRAGLALEQSSAGGDVPCSELAHHFGIAARAGHELSRALRYTALAAEQALGRLAFEEAAAHVAQLLELEPRAGEMSAARRMDLTIVLAELRYRGGEAGAATALLREVLALAEQTQSDAHAVNVLGRLADRTFDGSPDAARARIALAERLLPRLTEQPRLAAQVSVALGEDLYWIALERSRALNEHGLAMAREHRNPIAHSRGLAARFRLLTHPGQVDELRHTAREAVRLGRRTGDAHLVFSAWFTACASRSAWPGPTTCAARAPPCRSWRPPSARGRSSPTCAPLRSARRCCAAISRLRARVRRSCSARSRGCAPRRRRSCSTSPS